tara:strand:+ start:384 stop:569 length:186 start_codon:yes stop_codon:yes gene_type:complete
LSALVTRRGFLIGSLCGVGASGVALKVGEEMSKKPIDIKDESILAATEPVQKLNSKNRPQH